MAKESNQILLEKIFEMLYKREFSTLEFILMSYIEHIFKRSVHSEISEPDMRFVLSIYRNFNEQYLNWLEKSNYDIEKEIDELTSLDHDNFMIAQCTDSAAIDDLFFELLEYITTNHYDHQKEEVEYHLNCYKKHFSPKHSY